MSSKASIQRIPVIFKDYEGKPTMGGMGLGFTGTERVESATLKQIAHRTWGEGVYGKLFINGDYDIERWLQDDRNEHKSPRKQRYFRGSALMIIDIDEGLPEGTLDETIDRLIEQSEVISKYAGALFPSSSYRNSHPKMHILFALDGLITDWDEYKDLHGRLRRAIPFESDDATQTPTQPLYGTQHKYDVQESVMGHEWDHVLPIDFLRSLPALPAPLTKKKRERVEREGTRRYENAKRGKRHVRSALQLVRFIFDRYVSLGVKMSNPEWHKFRLAAQAASGSAMVVFDEMAKHPYWQHDIWDVETERYRWESEEPHTVTVGTLYAMAHELGWGEVNAADIVPDHRVSDLSELPAFESYLLKADTGIGKSQAQKVTIAGVREAGKKICWLVPTKTLSQAAATDFRELGATVYLDEDNVIKSSKELREAEFIVTTPQTFAKRIAPHGLDSYGLLVLDEVQQIGNAAFEDNNELWRDTDVLKAFQRGIEGAKATEGLIVRGLDAGLARMAQEWLGFPTYECTMHREKAPVTMYSNEAAMMDVLHEAVSREDKLTYVTCDTKRKSDEVAQEIRESHPNKRVLLINPETLDTRKKNVDERAIAFMKDPNGQVGDYDVIVVSPTMLTGVSIVARAAAYVFQFCSYLLPKQNLQMLNRFRRQGQVFVRYSGTGVLGSTMTAEEATDRAEVLLRGLPAVPRSAMAVRANELRELVELDALYQSLDPQAYYVRLLEGEGREVVHNTEAQTATSRKRKEAANKALNEWALDHYHEDEIEEYDPLKRYHGVKEEVMEAMLLKRKVNRRTLGGWTHSDDKRQTAEDACQFRSRHLTLAEVKTGNREQGALGYPAAMDEDLSLSRIEADDKILLLLHGLKIIGYTGQATIPAEVFVQYGEELIRFLSNNADYWNAVFPKTKQLELTGDYVADVRQCTKDLLSLIGLRLRRGARTRVLHNGQRLFNADVENIEALKRMLYLRACGRAMKERKPLPDGIEFVFRELSAEAAGEANIEALDWFMGQPKAVQRRVKAEMYITPDFVKCVNSIRHGGDMPF